ncbi:PLC-like phosphodiesterase [Aspergillus egyptiacus]|nr:PLC-like phosphodiesterase [Aspergillus egyptiacus]
MEHHIEESQNNGLSRRHQKRVSFPPNPVTKLDVVDGPNSPPSTLAATSSAQRETSPYPMSHGAVRRVSSLRSLSTVKSQSLENVVSARGEDVPRRDDPSYTDDDDPPPGGESPQENRTSQGNQISQNDQASEETGAPQDSQNFKSTQTVQASQTSQGSQAPQGNRPSPRLNPNCGLLRPIICNRAHPVPSLQNTPVAYRDMPYYCSGVTAQVQLSRDAVPIIFHDTHLTNRYSDNRAVGSLTWQQLLTVHSNSDKDPNTKIMRLSDLLKVLMTEENIHRIVFLEFKTMSRPGTNFVMRIKRVLSESPHSQLLVHRLVICVPSYKYLHDFRTVFKDHKLLLKCQDLGPARKVLRDPAQIPVYFMIDRRVLLSLRGRLFLREAKQDSREVYIDKVDDLNEMEWCIREGLNGIVTDRPRQLEGLLWELEQSDRNWMTASMPRTLMPRLILNSINPGGGIRRLRQLGQFNHDLPEFKGR